MGKTMEEHLRFAVAYWHTFTGDGSDPFGDKNMIRPWDKYKGMDLAKARVEAAFEFLKSWVFHISAFTTGILLLRGDNLIETNQNLDKIVAMIKDYMRSSKVKLLWNTSNLFTNPRYVHGAATSCNADVFAHAAAQVKKSLEVAVELDAEN